MNQVLVEFDGEGLLLFVDDAEPIAFDGQFLDEDPLDIGFQLWVELDLVEFFVPDLFAGFDIPGLDMADRALVIGGDVFDAIHHHGFDARWRNAFGPTSGG
jgi:hypothetical protein